MQVRGLVEKSAYRVNALWHNFDMAIPGAHDVTALIITEQHSAGRSVDKKQLQKLLYLVTAAHYAMWGDRAFREPIHAFKAGPVVKPVEISYRTGDGYVIDGPLGGSPDRVDKRRRATVRFVLDHFGGWTADNLERYIKRTPDSPWNEVRGELPRTAPSDVEIPQNLILAWARRNPVVPAHSVADSGSDLDLASLIA